MKFIFLTSEMPVSSNAIENVNFDGAEVLALFSFSTDKNKRVTE